MDLLSSIQHRRSMSLTHPRAPYLTQQCNMRTSRIVHNTLRLLPLLFNCASLLTFYPLPYQDLLFLTKPHLTARASPPNAHIINFICIKDITKEWRNNRFSQSVTIMIYPFHYTPFYSLNSPLISPYSILKITSK